MGTQRKRRWDGKRTQQQKKHGSDKKTPESLIAQGNLQEAVRLLRGHIRTTPTDEKKRLLGACLVVLEHYQEAAAAWLSIQEKTADDLQWVGVAYLNAKDWEHALQFLDESIQLKEEKMMRFRSRREIKQKNNPARFSKKRFGSILTMTKSVLNSLKS